MRHFPGFTGLLGLGFTLAVGTAHALPVVQNGSFEAVKIGSPFVSSNPADILGWTHTGTVGDGLLWAIGYADGGGSVTVAGQGQQFVTLGGGFLTSGSASWTSVVTGLTPGSSYNLTFMVAFEGGDTPLSQQTMTVGFDSGSSTPSQDFSAPSNSENYWRVWLPETLKFVATATSATMDFSVSNQINDMGLDNVQVLPTTTPVPEPLALSLFGVGLAGIMLIRRRFA